MEGGADGAPRALDELGRPGKPEREQLPARQLAALDARGRRAPCARAQLGVGRGARVGDVDAGRALGALPHEPVLPEREAVPGGQRVREDVVRERLHAPARQTVDSSACSLSDRFAGKTGLVLGVANRRSIAWAIAQRLAEGGAYLAFTYQGERIEKSVRELAETRLSPLVTACDVRSDEDLERVFGEVGEAFGGKLDLLVHSVAFADARDLEGRFTDTPRDRFWLALDVSAYSLVACARAAEPLMEAAGGGSILTMTYLGGERAVPHYNVMGVAKATLDSSVRYLAWDLGQKNIRVNAVSAGPVRTLAARSIAGFPTMEAIVEERAPLHRHDRRRRHRRRRGLPPLGRGDERHRHDAVRRRRLPRDGHVEVARGPLASPGKRSVHAVHGSRRRLQMLTLSAWLPVAAVAWIIGPWAHPEVRAAALVVPCEVPIQGKRGLVVDWPNVTVWAFRANPTYE